MKLTFMPAPGLLIILFGLLGTASAQSQVYGCRDTMATNYVKAATKNDGSCMYNATNYNPPIKVDPISDTLRETSGLQWAGNSLWSFNDGGGLPALYRIDTATRAILQIVTLDSATNIDWEDITFDGTYFYIGDFGNNANGARRDLKIYKFSLSAIPDYAANPAVTIPKQLIETISFTYSDQGTPVATSMPNTTKFDCEAMIIDAAKIHLFSKDWINNSTTEYIISGTTGGSYVAKKAKTLNTGFLVTAADKVPGKKTILLLGYENAGFGKHYLYLLTDFAATNFFKGNKRKIALPDATQMGQAEGIAFKNNSQGFISNERFQRSSGPFTLIVNQRLRKFDIGAYLPVYVKPKANKTLQAYKKDEGVQVEWTAGGETRGAVYEIEKAVNGRQFEKVATVITTGKDNGDTDLSWFDINTQQGNNFYRVKATGKNGETSYSDIGAVKINKQNNGFTIYPNPVKGNVITFQLRNVEKGHYVVKLFNNVNQETYLGTIEHSGIEGTYSLNTTATVGAGMYRLVLSGAKRSMNQMVLVE